MCQGSIDVRYNSLDNTYTPNSMVHAYLCISVDTNHGAGFTLLDDVLDEVAGRGLADLGGGERDADNHAVAGTQP